MVTKNMKEEDEKMTNAIGTPKDIKARIGAAFRAMRKRGFIARANFMCCGGCAVAEIADMDTVGKHGFVYYHAQDNERLLEGGDCMIGHGMLHGKTPETNAAAVFVDEARKQGLAVEWDGTSEHRVAMHGLDMSSTIIHKELLKAFANGTTDHNHLVRLATEIK